MAGYMTGYMTGYMASHQEHVKTYIMRHGHAPSAEATLFTEANVSEFLKRFLNKESLLDPSSVLSYSGGKDVCIH